MNVLSFPFFRPKALPPAASFPERAAMAIQTPQALPSWYNQASFLGNPYNFIPAPDDLLLYEQLIRTVPIINAALTKTVELIGTARFEHADDAVEAELGDWLKRVRVNRTQHGFANWQNTWMLDHLAYGRAHAELIPSYDFRDIAAIQELHPRTIAFRPQPDGYSVDIVQWQVGRGEQVTLRPETMLNAIYDVRTDNPYGSSLLHGLPFTAEILAAMMFNLGETWKRYGTPTSVITYKPPENLNDPEGTETNSILSSMLAMLRDVQKRRMNNDIADVGFVGEVELNVLGAQSEVLEFPQTARAILEPIVAKLGLPPMMLGLQWQAGERIGTEQAKLLSARIDAMRQALEPELYYAVRLRQALAGKPQDVKLCWTAPTLSDALETARGDFFQSQAEEKEQANDLALARVGVITMEEFARRHREDLEELSDEEIRTLLPLLATEAPALPTPQPFGGGPGASGNGNGNGNGQMSLRSLTYGQG